MIRFPVSGKAARLSIVSVLTGLTSVAAFADTLNFDFGSGDLKTSGYNNVTAPSSGTLSSLVNSTGAKTPMSLAVTKPFNSGANTAGTTAPASTAGFPASATRDSLFGYDSFNGMSKPEARFELRGLQPNGRYDLVFFASRIGMSANLSTAFTVTGASTLPSVTLNASGNTSQTVQVAQVAPSASGVISVSVKKGAGNNHAQGFYYLSAMRVNYKPVAAPSPSPSPSPRPSATPTPSPTPPVSGNVHTLQVTNGREVYRPTGKGLENWKPGDIVNIPAGHYDLIDIGNFRGSADKPIIIRNFGGQVVAKQIRLSNKAQYFKLQGNGDPAFAYGIKVDGENQTNAGVSAYASDYEVSNVEVTRTEAGFLMKKNPVAGDPSTQFPNYAMNNLRLLNNYIHHVKGEAMYIGHTATNGDPFSGNLIPIVMSKVEIAYNRIDHAGWDGIQLANATDGNKIHHNVVTNFGEINKGSQQAGIILGGNSTGEIYANVVRNGTGNGIQAFGYGSIRIYDNTIENTGADGTAIGQETIFCNDYPVKTQVRPKQRMLITNNVIRNPQSRGAVRVGAYNDNSDPGELSYNQLAIPNAPSDWESKHLICGAPGCVKTGNRLVP